MGFCMVQFLLLLLATHQAPPAAASPQVERFQKQFNFYPGGTIELSAGLPGGMRVVGWNRAAVRIEAEKVVRAEAGEQAAALSKLLAVDVRWNQTTATVRTTGPLQATGLAEVHLAVYVPREKTDLRIRLIRGDLRIGAINGSIEASLLQGSIEAKSLSGYFSGFTRKGDVRAEMAGGRWEGAAFTAATDSGSVELFLPADYSAGLHLETRAGKISVDYPAPVVDGSPVRLQPSPRGKGAVLALPLGAGGASVRLQSRAGDISLALRRALSDPAANEQPAP